jgi:hypothetical protein
MAFKKNSNKSSELQQEPTLEPTLDIVVEQSADPSEITATIEAVNLDEAPVTISGKKIQPSEHLSTRKSGVSLRNIASGKIVSSNIDERIARQMVRDFPTKVEIV